MNHVQRRGLACAVLALTLGSTGVAFGEVSTFINPQTGTISGIILGRIIEDADPIEGSIWQMIRPNYHVALNPDGASEQRTDGVPSIVRLDDGTAIAFWDRGLFETERDIVMSRWSPAGWGPIEWVSDSAELELDPRATIDDEGTIHLAWWLRPVAGTSRELRYRALAADGTWGATETIVSNADLSHPENLTRIFSHVDVAVYQDKLFFAYEALDTLAGVRWIEISKRLDGEDYVYEALFPIDAGVPSAELALHGVGEVMWIEWRVAGDAFAYSVFNGTGWSEPGEVALAGDSWVDVEQARQEIRRAVVTSQLAQARAGSGG